MIYRCLFEQSGTFKNEFKKLGYLAFDYDILNEFGQTDYIIDLYAEIEKAFEEKESIFDNFINDLVIAFFPCTRFENQIYMWFQGNAKQQKEWNDEKKLLYNLKLHKELSKNYEIITKLVLVCIRKKIKLIIENPYSTTHYLTRYWSIKPKIIDFNRQLRNDFYVKPTQFYFINFEPKRNFINYETNNNNKKKLVHVGNQTKRSLISSDYAKIFILENIIDYEGNQKNTIVKNLFDI